MSEVLRVATFVTLGAPLLGAALLFAAAWPRRSNERLVVDLTRASLGVALIASSTVLFIAWSAPPRVLDLGVWFEASGRVFPVTILVDRLSAVMTTLSLGACALVGHFSRTYLHGEPGHARFFFLLTVFALGMTILVGAGSLGLLFVGWEVVGLTSVLLIGFFHERRGPVRNGLRAFITYRLCDAALLLAILSLHHFGAEAELDPSLEPGQWAAALQHLDEGQATLVAMLLTVGAMGKSAQFPVGGWLPRAMEGPTPSSAIFYGALSVHAGVYLLIRAQSLFVDSPAASAGAIAVGLTTAVLATLAGRVQADVKNGLAFSVATQVGLMFVELGLHLPTVAAVHLVGHACLRMWQLLRAPAVLADLSSIRGGLDDDFETGRLLHHIERRLPRRVGAFLFQRALDRFHLDELADRWVAAPVLRLSRALAAIERRVERGPDREPESDRESLRSAPRVRS
ncbi:MAG: proton-conducting transporter membrane subunit [Sandaracinaceae bacterium]|nr:proton-conducting membrane transporter [Myxococcales bacterium]